MKLLKKQRKEGKIMKKTMLAVTFLSLFFMASTFNAGMLYAQSAAEEHAGEGVAHAKEGVAHLKTAIEHLEESLKADKNPHAKEAIEHAKAAIKHAEEAITHAEAASGKARTKKNY